jgi:uncharacterized membrane protein YeaQ/YmgE (transglycosylase-associated protein family)
VLVELLLHVLIGALVGWTLSWIAETDFKTRSLENMLIGALAASLAGAVWLPLCQSFSMEGGIRALAPLWSMGMAMLVVIGNAELRRWP